MATYDHKLKPYEDPNNPNNGSQHHTGKPCVEHGCTNLAGTAWSVLVPVLQRKAHEQD